MDLGKWLYLQDDLVCIDQKRVAMNCSEIRIMVDDMLFYQGKIQDYHPLSFPQSQCRFELYGSIHGHDFFVERTYLRHQEEKERTEEISLPEQKQFHVDRERISVILNEFQTRIEEYIS